MSHRWNIEPHPVEGFDILVTNSDEEAKHAIDVLAGRIVDGELSFLNVKRDDSIEDEDLSRPVVVSPPALLSTSLAVFLMKNTTGDPQMLTYFPEGHTVYYLFRSVGGGRDSFRASMLGREFNVEFVERDMPGRTTINCVLSYDPERPTQETLPGVPNVQDLGAPIPIPDDFEAPSELIKWITKPPTNCPYLVRRSVEHSKYFIDARNKVDSDIFLVRFDWVPTIFRVECHRSQGLIHEIILFEETRL